MNKFKLIAASLLASSILLSGCGEHTHVDKDGDFICDECKQPLTGVESISIICDESVAENETIELKANVKVHGVANDVTWSVISGTGSGEIVTEEGKTFLKGVKEGSVTVRATSVANSSKFAEKTVTVYTKGFAPELIDLGLTFSRTFPVAELKEMFGDKPTIFEPSVDISARGLYFIHEDADPAKKTAESFLVIYNLDASKAVDDPEIREMGAKLDSQYYGAEYLYSFGLEDGNVGFIDNTFTYEFDTFFIGSYYSMYWYRVSDFYADETKTTNEDWTEEEKSDMQYILHGEVLPFFKMGAEYDHEVSYSGSGYINFYDYCCDYRICEGYKQTLLNNGFEYDSDHDVFKKKLAENSYLYVDVYFDEYGNEIYAYVDSEILDEWPTEKVNNFVTNTLGSENSIPAFNYEAETEMYKYTESPISFNVTTQYATYDDVAAYIDSLINENGYKLVNTGEFVTIFLDDPSTCDGKFALFELEKGYINLTISISPLYKPDEILGIFPAEFYFDYCNVSFDITNSGGYEVKGIYIDDNKLLEEGEKLALQKGDEYALDIVKCKLSDEAVITASVDNDILTVTNEGVITATGIGDATVTFTANDGGTIYTDTIDVSIDYKTVDEYASISDYFDEISENGYFLLEESGVVCLLDNGTGEDYVIDSTEGTLTLNEGNTISFIASSGERITYVGFSGAVSDEAVITPDYGEFVKDGWYATDVEPACTLTVTSGSYTISDLEVLVNGKLLPVPSEATAKSLAAELTGYLNEWSIADNIVVDDQWDEDIYINFDYTEYIPSDCGFSIEEAYEYCVDWNILFSFSEEFSIWGEVYYGVNEDGFEYGQASYWTEGDEFALYVTFTVDTVNDVYLVECEIIQC